MLCGSEVHLLVLPFCMCLGTLHRLDWTDDGQLLTVSTMSGEHDYMIVVTVTVSCVLHCRWLTLGDFVVLVIH